MTRALRRRHRRLVVGLAGVLAIGIAAAIASRPDAIADARASGAHDGLRVAARIEAPVADASPTRLELVVTSDVAQPERLA